jgi:hypothetical protein
MAPIAPLPSHAVLAAKHARQFPQTAVVVLMANTTMEPVLVYPV